MTFDNLWAGWRSEYVSSVPHTLDSAALGDLPVGQTEEDVCVFCKIVGDGSPDVDRGVVATSDLSIVLLNAYPYASGHVLVMPQRHVHELGDLSSDEASDLWSLALAATAAVQAAYEPDGMNLGANLGRAAGAGIPKHLHLHIVPRWIGDTNFMTSIASVRVLPEPLPRSWEKLRAAWTS